MIQTAEPIVSQCANKIVYSCGCICEFQLVGLFAEMKEWHIITCFSHCNNVPIMERRADSDWERITSEVRS